MLESINNIYETIFEELKTYLQDNSLYNPYVYKKEPNNKLFPVVVVKELFNESNYTTLKYTDEIYYIDPYEKNRYIKLDCIFQQTHEEKLAELEYIAYSLLA